MKKGNSFIKSIILTQIVVGIFILLLTGCGPANQAGEMSVVTETGSITIDGFELGYHIEGNGPNAVVIGSSLIYPRCFSEKLKKQLRFVFIDHRGFVRPPDSVDASAYELETIINDVEIIRKQLDLGEIVVIGHSGHSYMALEYAKMYPQNVSHVVMIGISPDLGESSAMARDRYWEEFASAERKAVMKERLKQLTDEQLERISPEEAYSKRYIRNAPKIWYDPNFDCSPLWEGVYPNIPMLDYVWGKLFAEIDITQGLESFEIPVFLAVGRYDFLLAPPSSWDPLKPKFKNLTLQVYEQSGHFPFYEEAELFDEELIKWMM